jgi:hypothetical protein
MLTEQGMLLPSILKRKARVRDDFWEDGIKLSRYSVTKWCETNLVEER